MRLSTQQQWEDRWKRTKKNNLKFDPLTPTFRERHKLFEKHIPRLNDGTVLEVGAYPGTYLRYFYEYFGYTPWGVEYVESCARYANELLNKESIPGEIINEDFFKLNPEEHLNKSGWDITASFGFVEHFTNPKEAIAKHIEVTRPGGLIIISIPNHAGINGWILRKVDQDKWAQHNHMSLSELIKSVKSVGDADIIFSGQIGHIGFWNAGLYPALLSKMKKAYPIFRAPFWILEHVGQWIVPNNRWTSPDFLIIARKKY